MHKFPSRITCIKLRESANQIDPQLYSGHAQWALVTPGRDRMLQIEYASAKLNQFSTLGARPVVHPLGHRRRSASS